jgi:TRAP-type C4-dicarboxylate transport system permease small subunit
MTTQSVEAGGFVGRLYQACRFMTALLLAIMAVTVIYVVIARFIFDSTPPWSEELPRLCLVWMAYLAGAVALGENGHLRPGVPLPFAEGGTAARLVELANNIAILLFLAIVGWAGLKLSQLTIEQLTPALGVPAAAFYFALPVTYVLGIVFMVHKIIREWRA